MSRDPRPLLLVRPDATVADVPNTYEGIKQALDQATMDFVHGEIGGAYVDDEGLYNGLQFNVVASALVVRPLYGPCVLADNDPDDEGDTRALPDHLRSPVLALAERWRDVIRLATLAGQDIAVYANPFTVTPPVVLAMPDDWMPGDPMP